MSCRGHKCLAATKPAAPAPITAILIGIGILQVVMSRRDPAPMDSNYFRRQTPDTLERQLQRCQLRARRREILQQSSQAFNRWRKVKRPCEAHAASPVEPRLPPSLLGQYPENCICELEYAALILFLSLSY